MIHATGTGPCRRGARLAPPPESTASAFPSGHRARLSGSAPTVVGGRGADFPKGRRSPLGAITPGFSKIRGFPQRAARPRERLPISVPEGSRLQLIFEAIV